MNKKFALSTVALGGRRMPNADLEWRLGGRSDEIVTTNYGKRTKVCGLIQMGFWSERGTRATCTWRAFRSFTPMRRILRPEEKWPPDEGGQSRSRRRLQLA